MKRYLVLGSFVLSISVYGASNPFDIAKNMQKIEAEDSLLLDTLEEDSGKKKGIKSDDFVVHHKVKKKKTVQKKSSKPKEIKPKVLKSPNVDKVKVEQPKKLNPVIKKQKQIPKPKVVDAQKKPNNAITSTTKVINTKKKDDKKTIVAIKKRQNVENIIVDIDEPITHKTIKNYKQKSSKQKKQLSRKNNKDMKLPSSVADINITKEQIEAKKKALQKLEEAMKEVDNED